MTIGGGTITLTTVHSHQRVRVAARAAVRRRREHRAQAALKRRTTTRGDTRRTCRRRG